MILHSLQSSLLSLSPGRKEGRRLVPSKEAEKVTGILVTGCGEAPAGAM